MISSAAGADSRREERKSMGRGWEMSVADMKGHLGQ